MLIDSCKKGVYRENVSEFPNIINKNRMLATIFTELKFPLIVLVVFIHIFGENINLSNIDYFCLTEQNIYDIIRILFSKKISLIAVPGFFLISGYFFFYSIEKLSLSLYVSKLHRRIYTLLIPYILWNIIAFVLILLEQYLYFLLKGESRFVGNDCAVWRIFEGTTPPLYAPVNFPLWYVRDLLVLIILSPIIYLFIKKIGIFAMLLLAVLFYFQNYTFEYVPYLFTVNSLFFFSLGVYISLKKIDVILICRKYWFWSLILSLSLIILMVYYHDKSFEFYFSRLYFVTGLVFIIRVMDFFYIEKNFRFPNILINATFFIYAVHTIVFIRYLANLLSFEVSHLNQIIGYFVQPLATIGLCLGIYWILLIFFPNVLKILVGNRN